MKIKATDKVLTRKAVLEIVKNQIFQCEEVMEKWREFEEYVDAIPFNNIIFQGGKWVLDKWLESRPWAKAWLVKHGFATEVDDFVPFVLEVRTKEEAASLYHRLNLNDPDFNRAYQEAVAKERNSAGPVFGMRESPVDYQQNTDPLWRRVSNEIRKQNGFKSSTFDPRHHNSQGERED